MSLAYKRFTLRDEDFVHVASIALVAPGIELCAVLVDRDEERIAEFVFQSTDISPESGDPRRSTIRETIPGACADSAIETFDALFDRMRKIGGPVMEPLWGDNDSFVRVLVDAPGHAAKVGFANAEAERRASPDLDVKVSVPDLDEIMSDPSKVKEIMGLVESGNGGIIPVPSDLTEDGIEGVMSIAAESLKKCGIKGAALDRALRDVLAKLKDIVENGDPE